MKKLTILLAFALAASINLSAQVEPIDTDGNDYRNVSTLDHLRWISENSVSWSDDFELDNDINAADTENWNGGEGWMPIGNEVIKFEGNFNGNGFEIDGIFINKPNSDNIGFFGYAEYAIINNLEIANAIIMGDENVGALIGQIYGSPFEIKNCISSGSVTGLGSNTGGLIGKVDGGNNSEVINSSSSCNVFGQAYKGGLIGNNDRGNINNCFAEGNISGSNYIGGLCGQNYYGKIENCYAKGNVSGNERIGGLVGSNYYGSILKGYSTGNITGNNLVGGLIGAKTLDGTITNCFWDTETSGQANSAGGTGKTSAEMKTESTFTDAGWDISLIWGIDPAENDGYPFFNWYVYEILNISLTTGWNMISSYVEPEQTDMDFIFANIKDDILLVKNGLGQIYAPSFGIDDIGNWNVLEGYQVYATAPTTLTVIGNEIVPENTPISLKQGWNMVSYLINTSTTTNAAFQTIVEDNNLLLAKNSNGQIYAPEFNIDDIVNINPTEGYQLYLTSADVLTYPTNKVVEYETVVIGGQEWMQKNLDVTHYRNGDEIFHAESSEDWQYARDNSIGAWCYYNNDPANGEIYGKLYNWHAVNDSRGLAPEGYHVPSDAEWTELKNFLSYNSQYWCNNNKNYLAKSIASKEYWKTHSNICVVGTNREENNTSGFTGFPGGYRSVYEETFFTNIENTAYWWSSTNSDELLAWCTYIYYYDTGVGRFRNHKGYGFSVRCVKD